MAQLELLPVAPRTHICWDPVPAACLALLSWSSASPTLLLAKSFPTLQQPPPAVLPAAGILDSLALYLCRRKPQSWSWRDSRWHSWGGQPPTLWRMELIWCCTTGFTFAKDFRQDRFLPEWGKCYLVCWGSETLACLNTRSSVPGFCVPGPSGSPPTFLQHILNTQIIAISHLHEVHTFMLCFPLGFSHVLSQKQIFVLAKFPSVPV